MLRLGGAAALAALGAACAPPPSPTAIPTKPAAVEPTKPAAVEPTRPAAATTAPAAAPTRPAPPPSAPAPTGASAAPTAPAAAVKPAGETVYVFNVGSKDVTLVDAATRQPIGTRPLGAQVRWLSNEQTYWDGQQIWTYDFPDNKLQAIAIDPAKLEVARKIEGIGTGPGHSLVVLPGGKKAAVNVAGDNVIAFLDLPSGKIEGTMKTGAFP